mgnify:CR=1 FL=1
MHRVRVKARQRVVLKQHQSPVLQIIPANHTGSIAQARRLWYDESENFPLRRPAPTAAGAGNGIAPEGRRP